MKKLILAVFFIYAGCFAGTGSDTMTFLKINPSARGSSLGDGFSSVSGDVNSSVYNPASIARLEIPQVSFMHLAYVADTSYEFLNAAMPVSKNISLGVLLCYMSYGSMAITGENSSGIYIAGSGSFSPYDIMGGLTLSYKLGKELSTGLTVKYAYENINGADQGALLFDAGVLFSGESTGAGFAIYNAGTAIAGDNAPMGVRAGISYKVNLMKDNDIMLLAGGNYNLAGQKITGSLGAEYWYEGSFGVRGSYTLNSDCETLNAGAGFKGNMDGVIYGLDYNFSLLGDLGSAHRISLTIGLAENGGTRKQTTNNGRNKYFIPKGVK